jgi:CDGSH-type Zn-finger protein/uncharacterized Fe-S cluster protein YjdI
MSKVVNYEGEQATVRWDGALCIHVGECGRADCALFEGGRDPWCKPDEVTVEQVDEVVTRCPSGALSYTRHDGGDGEAVPTRNTIVVTNQGPLYLRGNLKIEGASDEQEGLRTRAALCRCGLSGNKPFCDNSHEGAFDDRGAVGAMNATAEQLAEGPPLSVTLAPNGPLLFSGPCEVVAASGRVAWRGTKGALCRCGQSSNKPWCDGSHKAAGFEG